MERVVITFFIIVCTIVNGHFSERPGIETETGTIQRKDPYTFSCLRWSCEHFYALRKNGTWDNSIGYYDQMGCACDELCPFFEDCCEDYRPREDDDEIINRFRKSGLRPGDFSCLKINGVDVSDHIHVVNKCPSVKTDSKIKQWDELCRLDPEADNANIMDQQSYLLSLPVTGKKSHAIYRNIYCALCHNEPHVAWFPEIRCIRIRKEIGFLEGNITFSEIMEKPWCPLRFRPPYKIKVQNYYRACYPAIDYCRYPNRVPKDVEKECVTGKVLQMVHRHYFAFKNPFCGSCFVGNMSFVECEKPKGMPNVFMGRPYPFTILFDLKRGTFETRVGESVTVQKAARSCGKSSFFDPFSFTCREVICPDSMVFDGEICSIDETNVNSTIYNSTANVTCIQIELNHTEFNFNGSHIHLLGRDTVFEPTFLVRTDNGIRVCSNEAGIQVVSTRQTPGTIVIRFSRAEGIVSACGMSVSIVALSLTVAYFLKMKMLAKTPNRCILSMTISLLLANSFLLAGSFLSGLPILCKIFGILTHYVFLVVFMWMNVMALDMWIAFSRLKNSLENSSNRFVHYSLYAWLVPVFIVLVALFLDTFHPDNQVSPRYGSGLCWISSETSLTIFFAVPLAMILIINTTLFVPTARNLYLTQRRASHGPSSGGRNINNSKENTSTRRHGKQSTIIVYVKLTVIVGLTWILGFIMLLWDHPIITYAFILVNSLHGLSVLATCLSTRSFKRQMASSFINLRSVLATPQTSNSSNSETKITSSNTLKMQACSRGSSSDN